MAPISYSAVSFHLKSLFCVCDSPKDIVVEVLSFAQLKLYKPKLCCHVLFIKKTLSPEILVHSVSNCNIMNFIQHSN